MFGNGVPRLRNKGYQNQKLLLPEPGTRVTKTREESYQKRNKSIALKTFEIKKEQKALFYTFFM